MTKSALINAREVAEILGTSKSHAYKMVQKLNDELASRATYGSFRNKRGAG